MSKFTPSKLHVSFDPELQDQKLALPRRYTLTHSDLTGDLFLKVGLSYDDEKLSDWYTRLMRDEVLGDWIEQDRPVLHIHCHVSGGFVLGPAKWRMGIFKHHLPMALNAICHGDRDFIEKDKAFMIAPLLVHFHAKQDALNQVETWGTVQDYIP